MQLLGKSAVKGRWRRKVRFIELGFADALAALQSGKIDAMVGAEPFGTAAIAAGFPAIDSPYIAMSKKSMLTSAYFIFENPLKDNPERSLFRAADGGRAKIVCSEWRSPVS
jgi:NitT/TauT family transport system substrate-binding protein